LFFFFFFFFKEEVLIVFFFFFQAEDGIRDADVTGVQTCALPISAEALLSGNWRAVERRQGFRIWVEAGGSAALVERHKRELVQLAQVAGASTEPMDVVQAETNWTRATDLGSWLPGVVPNPVIVEGRLPVAAGETFVECTLAEAERRRVRVACFGQIATGVISLCLTDAADAASGLPLINRLRE